MSSLFAVLFVFVFYIRLLFFDLVDTIFGFQAEPPQRPFLSIYARPNFEADRKGLESLLGVDLDMMFTKYHKNVFQGCTRVSHKKECPAKVQQKCRLRVSYKSALQESPTRVLLVPHVCGPKMVPF